MTDKLKRSVILSLGALASMGVPGDILYELSEIVENAIDLAYARGQIRALTESVDAMKTKLIDEE